MKFVAERHGLGQRGVGVLAQRLRQPLAGIHEALTGQSAETRISDRSQQPTDARTQPDVLDGRGAGKQTLGGAQQRAPVGAFVVMRRFERPDPLLEPGEQAAPFSQTAKESLSEVDVTLH
jgi:hypothetical protein